MRLSLPSGYPSSNCGILAVDTALLPLIARALQTYLEERIWTEEDYPAGYRAFSVVIAQTTANCLTDITDRLDRLYRLMDSGLYGTVYSVESTDPLVIVPPIADAPDSPIIEPGLLWKADQIVQLVDSSINGTETPIYGIPVNSVRAQLQAILDALTSSDTDLSTIISDLETMIVLLG